MTDGKAPRCPGCHFTCRLDAYRCGRGQAFWEMWLAGEPVPERKGPGPVIPDSQGGLASKPSVGARVMLGLNVAANNLQDRHTESSDRKVLLTVGRQGGFFALSLLGHRTLIDQEPMLEAVELLVQQGLLERYEDDIAGASVRITSAGKEKQAQWNAERAQANDEFLSVLTPEEQAQLADMLTRLARGRM